MTLILVSPPHFLACGQYHLEEQSGMLITHDLGELQSRMLILISEEKARIATYFETKMEFSCGRVDNSAVLCT